MTSKVWTQEDWKNQLQTVPRWLLVALAARCAELLKQGETLQELPKGVSLEPEEIARIWNVAGKAWTSWDYGDTLTIPDNAQARSDTALHHVIEGFNLAVGAASQEYGSHFALAISTDSGGDAWANEEWARSQELDREARFHLASAIQALSDKSESLRSYITNLGMTLSSISAHATGDSAPSNLEMIFATYCTFDLDPQVHENGTIVDVSTLVNQRLIEYFRLHPRRMYELTPHQFEELVAELWIHFGFDVELTAQTRDGGRDVIAIGHSPAHVKYLIECKRWAERRSVGIAPVQRLLGTVIDDGANKGILASTAGGFSKPAKKVLDRHAWMLEGRDFAGLVEWLELYDQLKMEAVFKRTKA